MEKIDFEGMSVAQLIELQAQIKAQKSGIQDAEDKAKIAHVGTLNKMEALIALTKAIAGEGINNISTEKSFEGRKYKISIALVSDSKATKPEPCDKAVASWELKDKAGKVSFFRSFKDACQFFGCYKTGNDKRAMAEAGFSTRNHVKDVVGGGKVWIDTTWVADKGEA